MPDQRDEILLRAKATDSADDKIVRGQAQRRAQGWIRRRDEPRGVDAVRDEVDDAARQAVLFEGNTLERS